MGICSSNHSGLELEFNEATVMTSLIQTVRGLMLIVPISVCLLSTCPLYADQAQYLYDDQGRLTSVIDSTGALAVYNYDSVGNLLSIDRFTPPGSGIGIYLTAPSRGSATTSVVVQGYGFSSTPANNTVKFNGVTATVTAATANRLTVTVPAGATTGPVSVTTTAGTANSPQTFTMLSSPTITSITPTMMGQGMKMPATVMGTGLLQATSVTFSHAGITGILQTGATDTSLSLALAVAATVPPGTYTFTVTTPLGTVGSGAVTVAVSTPVWGFVQTRFSVSVWRPNSNLSDSRTAVSSPVSPFISPSYLPPSGPTSTVSPPVSEYYVLSPMAPSGSTSTVAPPVSELLP